MKVGDLVYMTDEFYNTLSFADSCQRNGIVIRVGRAWVDPFMVEDDQTSIDGREYDCMFGSKLIQGLLWGWEITEVRKNECG